MKEVRMECLRNPYVVPWHHDVDATRPRGRQCFTLGNFITDATVRLSHGRPCGHHPTVRPSVRYRPHDNPGAGSL
jgi:hypothetical protein